MGHPSKIVDKMYENDAFSKWLGIKRIEDGAEKVMLLISSLVEKANALFHLKIWYWVFII